MTRSRPVSSDELRPPLLIGGASARAAAYSALRAGFRPICVDLFADEDLRAVAEVRRVDDYPRGLLDAADALPPAPWMYTGALENHPQIVEKLAAKRTLWGNAADAIRRVRDPRLVYQALQAHGLPALAVRSSVDPPAADGRWMLKPRRGAAGRGIRVWEEAATSAAAIREPHYFQERAGGEPISAVFVAAAGEVELIGVTRQFVGVPGLCAPPFAYCGSIGPLELPAEQVQAIRSTGAALARSFDLRGLFGCDFLLDEGCPWLTEVNPRYTASVEVLEYALGCSVLDRHAQACGPTTPNVQSQAGAPRAGATATPPLAAGIVAKAILFSPQDLVVNDALADKLAPAIDRLPEIADVPSRGSSIAAGHPVCTVLASAAGWGECERTLWERVRAIRSRLLPDGG